MMAGVEKKYSCKAKTRLQVPKNIYLNEDRKKFLQGGRKTNKQKQNISTNQQNNGDRKTDCARLNKMAAARWRKILFIYHYRLLFSFWGHLRMSIFRQLYGAILFGGAQSVCPLCPFESVLWFSCVITGIPKN